MERYRPRLDSALVLALTLLSIALYPFAALIVDSGRDLAWGLTVARGDAWPLYGPSLNGVWRPGPIWFYLLGLALRLTGEIGATALALGLIAAIKIPLAWMLGRRLRDSALGLSFATAIALPGWSTLGQLVLSHTMLVEISVLATLALCLRAAQSRSAGWAAGAALMLGVAVHAHPTALVAAPAVAWVFLRASSPRRVAWIVFGAVLFALPFAPALYAEARDGWPQLSASAGYFGGSDYLARLLRAPEVLWGASYGQSVFVRDFLLGRWPPLAWFVFGAGWLVLAAAAIGLLRGLVVDVWTRVILLLAALAWLFVLLLRDVTPAWMIYACAPFGAALLALGWSALWPARWRGDAARALAAFALIAGAALLADRIAATRSGEQSLPTAAIADIATPPQRDPPMRFWMPAFGHDALMQRLCNTPGEAALQGDLAAAIHFGQGVAKTLHCDAGQTIRLGGGAPRNIAGVPVTIAKALGISGETTSYGYVLATPQRVLHPPQGQPIELHTRYLLDDYLPRMGRDAPQTIRVRTGCEAGDVIVVTDLLPGLNQPFDLQGVGGEFPPLLAQTIASRYFACPPAQQIALDVIALDPAAVEVFMLRRTLP
jgi:hypothetical protein